MKIIIAILMFSFIIIFHELGHFLLAKKNKIKVNEFLSGTWTNAIWNYKGRDKIFHKTAAFWWSMYDGRRRRRVGK